MVAWMVSFVETREQRPATSMITLTPSTNA